MTRDARACRAGVGRLGQTRVPAAGSLTEWYRSAPPGLEQGFDLAERPEGEGFLAIEVEVGEGLRPELDEWEGSVALFEGEQGRLRYSDLFAEDAEGHQLPAHLTVEGQTIRLVVDDRDAVYPVSIDPIVWVFRQKLTAGADAAAGDNFGVSVAISGDTVVGADGDDDGGSDSGGRKRRGGHFEAELGAGACTIR